MRTLMHYGHNGPAPGCLVISFLLILLCSINGMAADEDLDTSFSGDGRLTTVIAKHATGQAVAIQPDGKIIVAGYANNGANDDFAAARYNTDGSLDTTFDGDGRVTTAIGGGNRCY